MRLKHRRQTEVVDGIDISASDNSLQTDGGSTKIRAMGLGELVDTTFRMMATRRGE